MSADAAKGLAAAVTEDAAATAPAATGGNSPATPAPAAGPPNPPCKRAVRDLLMTCTLTRSCRQHVFSTLMSDGYPPPAAVGQQVIALLS